MTDVLQRVLTSDSEDDEYNTALLDVVKSSPLMSKMIDLIARRIMEAMGDMLFDHKITPNECVAIITGTLESMAATAYAAGREQKTQTVQ